MEQSLDQDYNYLALARPEKSRVSLDEYRTDAQGALLEPGGWVVTKGFASMSIHFHPFYRNDSLFRYLGREEVDGSDAFVVAFAQRPGVARATGRVNLPERSVEVLVQGVAWIDPTTYQTARLRTYLLAPPEGSGLKRQTTEIRYREVRFKEIPSALRLPSEVTVTFEWKDEPLRNRHRYSDFRLFRVETEQKPQPVTH